MSEGTLLLEIEIEREREEKRSIVGRGSVGVKVKNGWAGWRGFIMSPAKTNKRKLFVPASTSQARGARPKNTNTTHNLLPQAHQPIDTAHKHMGSIG